MPSYDVQTVATAQLSSWPPRPGNGPRAVSCRTSNDWATISRCPSPIVVPFPVRTGINNIPDGVMAETIVHASGCASPFVEAYEGRTACWGSAQTLDGQTPAVFEARNTSYRGNPARWLRYVDLVAYLCRQQHCTPPTPTMWMFDLEVCNELTFGSLCLFSNYYYPVPEEAKRARQRYLERSGVAHLRHMPRAEHLRSLPGRCNHKRIFQHDPLGRRIAAARARSLRSAAPCTRGR